MDKQLIFFDIDGTLLDDDKKLPDSTKRAVQSLSALGHKVAIATGRSPHMFKELREELNIDTYISLNGQYVVNNGEAVYTNPLDLDELQRLTISSVKLNNQSYFKTRIV
jgi:HAD superfamily hydrolase (TIGR01484 family)